MTLNYI